MDTFHTWKNGMTLEVDDDGFTVRDSLKDGEAQGRIIADGSEFATNGQVLSGWKDGKQKLIAK
jgi:hypothetical protein